MNNRYICIATIFFIIISFFVSNLSANHIIIGENDNNLHNLFRYETNFDNKSMFSYNTKIYSCSTTNNNSSFGYIIITSQDFINSSFQVLINHKSQYINATIVTKEDILSDPSFWVNGTYGDATNKSNGNPYITNGEEVKTNYSRFNDTAAIIRNFIRFAHQNWKTEYIVLGGDVQIIPFRSLYVNISGWESGMLYNPDIYGWIPSDLYYGNLNGTWNNDFDDKFGERANISIKDEADLFSEVFIGRAPIDNKQDIAIFVHKVITFETTTKPRDILLHQSNLTPFDKPDTSVIPDACVQRIQKSYNISKLYQKNNRIDRDSWVKSFQKPKFIHLHIGNGYCFDPTNSWYQLYCSPIGKIKFYNDDVGKLNNSFFPIHISISCLTGNFNFSDCLAEELLLTPNGGPSACIFNSEMGCVKTNDVIAYSGEYIVRLFYEFFVNETRNLGKINQFTKEYFVKNSSLDPNYRWVIYETNLLGDPETPVFETRTKLPTNITYVDDDNLEGPWYGTSQHPYQHIQDGINASFDYQIVYINNGTYYENIIIDKTIQLVGQSKYSTIIDGGDIDNTIILTTNSSTITNFTIQHSNSDKDNKKYVGIFIPVECWGNNISNNIIMGNNKCGIFINNSCRNMIFGNIISFNGQGISMARNVTTWIPYNIIVTCGNTIRHNNISSNEGYGIYIKYILNNFIYNNNFINNNGGSDKDAYFYVSRDNEWDGNYWNEPRTTPKIIWGMVGPLYLLWPDFKDGLIFIHFNYKLSINVAFPYPDRDIHPAQQPYDIT